MDISNLLNRRKKLHRMLNVCKQKHIACKLYLKEQPEHASRTMLQYLASLEQKQKTGNPLLESPILGGSIFVGFIFMTLLLQLNISVIYFIGLIIFLGIVFFLPYYNSRKHISRTKVYIAESELPGLKQRIKNIRAEIEEITRRIETEAKRQSQQSKQKSSKKFTKSGLDLNQSLAALGLKPGASFDEAKKAFRKKIIKYHPDRTNQLSEDEQILAAKVTVKLNQAYGYIKKIYQN